MTTKTDFLNRLNELTAGLPESERERLAAHASEMIDDRVEMGMEESAAVRALGAPEALLKDAAPAVTASNGGDSADCAGEIREVHIHVKNADAQIVRRPLPGNMTAQLRASEANCFTWSLSDGVLTVAEAGEVRRGLFRRDAELTLILSDITLQKLIADSYGGDLELTGLEATEMAVLNASSGDIRLTRFTCGGRFEATARSGDVRLERSDLRGGCKLESTSGDVEMIRTLAPDARLSTASGDIKVVLPELKGGVAVYAQSDSGEVRVPLGAPPDAQYRIQARSVSGDIEILER